MSLFIEAHIQTDHSEGYSLAWDLNKGNIGVYGANGSGKTTLLKHLAGLGHHRQDRQSRISIDGQLLQQGPTNNPCVYVSQHPSLIPSMSVVENLRLVPRHSQWSARMNWDDVINVCKLAPLLIKTPAMLSGGELQLVALARALLSGKPVILLDEPFSALDYAARQHCLRLLPKIRAQYDIHFVLVSHHLQDIALCCEQILFIEQQHIAQFGPIDKVLHDIQQHSAEGYFSRLPLRPLHKQQTWQLVSQPNTVISAHSLPSAAVNDAPSTALIPAHNVTVHSRAHRDLFTNVLPCKLTRIHHESDGTVTLHLLHHKQRLLAQMSQAEFQALNLQPQTKQVNQTVRSSAESSAPNTPYDTLLYAHFASL
jgi:ABC-type molybdate transport system ATPase subunit